MVLMAAWIDKIFVEHAKSPQHEPVISQSLLYSILNVNWSAFDWIAMKNVWLLKLPTSKVILIKGFFIKAIKSQIQPTAKKRLCCANFLVWVNLLLSEINDFRSSKIEFEIEIVLRVIACLFYLLFFLPYEFFKSFFLLHTTNEEQLNINMR